MSTQPPYLDAFNHEVFYAQFRDQSVSIEAWDLAGRFELRGAWKYFYNAMGVSILCFVINAKQRSRLNESLALFQQLSSEAALLSSRKLILLNSFAAAQSLEIPLEDIRAEVGSEVTCLRVNAKTGAGFDELMEWFNSSH